MEKDSILHDPSFQPPRAFFDVLIEDIPAQSWARVLQQNPTLRSSVLEGFSSRPDRLPRLIRQPQITARIRRLLQHDTSLLDETLKIWGQEKLPLMAFLEMLHQDFIQENFLHLKNLLGPERLMAGLHLLDCAHGGRFPQMLEDDFWERKLDLEVLEPLIPVFDLWEGLARETPELSQWMGELTGSGPATPADPKAVSGGGRERDQKGQREEERRRRVEQRLESAQEEIRALHEQGQRHKAEAEQLRKNLAELQETFREDLRKAMKAQHEAWYRRFEEPDLPQLEEAGNRLDQLIRRARRALELQRQADEKYGLVAAVRQKILELNGLLREMEKIHDQSMFVHQEVVRVKGELQKEKQRLLQTPGIEKVLRDLPSSVHSESLEEYIRLLDPSPENLPRVSLLSDLVDRLESVGYLETGDLLRETLKAKKYQIFAPLYARFQPPRTDTASREALPDFEDFVRSGRSRRYDLYVDGYNILLNTQGSSRSRAGPSLGELREEFIRKVVEKSGSFRKVHLVFDGVEYSRDQVRNTEIVYTDKVQGLDADNHIIQAIRRRKDRNALLVTADLAIIEATEHRVYARMDPFHFYLFVFDVDFPFVP